MGTAIPALTPAPSRRDSQDPASRAVPLDWLWIPCGCPSLLRVGAFQVEVFGTLLLRQVALDPKPWATYLAP